MGGAMSYPTTVYLDEKLRLIGSVPGFFPAQTYTKVLQYKPKYPQKSVLFYLTYSLLTSD
jgi:thioredoxin-related protein